MKVVDVGVVVCIRGEIEKYRSKEEVLAVLVAAALAGHSPLPVLAYLGQMVGAECVLLPASTFELFFVDPARYVCTFLRMDVTLPCNIVRGNAQPEGLGVLLQED
jgi:hypothetical protein